MDNQTWERMKNRFLLAVTILLFAAIHLHDPVIKKYENYEDEKGYQKTMEHLEVARSDIDHKLIGRLDDIYTDCLLSGNIFRYERDQKFPYKECQERREFLESTGKYMGWADLVMLEVMATEAFDAKRTDEQYYIFWTLKERLRAEINAMQKEGWDNLTYRGHRIRFDGQFFPYISIVTPDHHYVSVSSETIYRDWELKKTTRKIQIEYRETYAEKEEERRLQEKFKKKEEERRQMQELISKNLKKSKGKTSETADPYDIDNYSDADEFADEWEDEFEDWDDAYMYYEDRRE